MENARQRRARHYRTKFKISSKKPGALYHGYKLEVDNKMKHYGTTNPNTKTVKVNKKKSLKNPTHTRPINKHAHKYPEVLDTAVHEMTHAKHPKMHEKTVYKHMKKRLKKMIHKQKAKVYAKFKS